MKDLVPTVVTEPVSSLPVAVDGCNPRRTKRSYTHRGVYNSLLVLGGKSLLHDFLQIFRWEYSIQGFQNSLGCGNIDAFAPIARD